MALTTDFVAAVRRQGSIPSTFASTDILGIGDEEIQGRFVPLLESLRQNYFVREISAVPDSRGRVPIPDRAVGAALRSVQLAVGNGWVPLPLRDLGDADYMSGGGLPDGYAIDGGSIILLPQGRTGTLRLRYAARPGKMVIDTDLSKAAKITAVTDYPLTGLTLLTSGAYSGSTIIDIISYGPAHQQKLISGPYSVGYVTTAQLLEQPIGGAGTIPGDYFCAADTSPFVPLPEELYSALVHSVAANILLAQGYLEEAGAQEAKAAGIINTAKLYLMPRNEGNPQVVRGGLRRALGGSRRGRW